MPTVLKAKDRLQFVDRNIIASDSRCRAWVAISRGISGGEHTRWPRLIRIFWPASCSEEKDSPCWSAMKRCEGVQGIRRRLRLRHQDTSGKESY